MITFFVFGPVGKTTWSELYIPVHAYLESNFKFQISSGTQKKFRIACKFGGVSPIRLVAIL
jgi:hypothetical protein